MRSSIPSPLIFTLLAVSAACQRDDADSRIAEFETDSGAIVSAAADAIVSTLRATTLSDSMPQRQWVLAPGPTTWDTLLVNELRRAEPSIASSTDDSTLVTTVSTHGVRSRRDTVDVTVVVRSCVRSDTTFNFTKDSVVHRLVRASTEGDEREWRLDGPVSHDHAVGECEPVTAPASDSPSG